jgi:membrane-associated phospholipid phosphatase
MVGGAVRAATEPRRLVPERLRRVAVRAMFCAGAILVVLSIAFWHTSTAPGIDRALDRPLVTRNRGHEVTVLRLADLGSPGPMFVLTFFVLVLALPMRRWRGALLLLLALPLASGVTEWVLKPLVHRTKGGVLAFPSGHSTGVFTLAFVVAMLMLDVHRTALATVARVVVAWAAILGAVVVAVALVASGFHYATDTLGGACVALIAVLAVSLGLDALSDRVRRR